MATEELPRDLAEAERLLGQHSALKEEINRYEEDYAKIQPVSEVLALEEADLPYLSLQQWLQKLDVGWNKLLEMWESRREALVQAHIFFLFLRDAKQAEICLYNQVRLARTPHAARGKDPRSCAPRKIQGPHICPGLGLTAPFAPGVAMALRTGKGRGLPFGLAAELAMGSLSLPSVGGKHPPFLLDIRSSRVYKTLPYWWPWGLSP